MIHSSNYKPRIYPVYGDVGSAEIDRLQELTATTTLNRTKIEEIGRIGIVDWRKSTPSVNVSLRQLEYGNIEFWQKLANAGSTVDTLQWTDFKTSASDIAGYKTDDSGTFLGTVYYPDLRLAGFGISIGDPQALVERSFNLVGEDEQLLLYGNKYLIFKRCTITAGSNQTVTLSNPVPIYHPDESGQFLLKVVRMRAGVGTMLLEPGDWSYDGAGALTIDGTSNTGDVILVWYSAGVDITGNNIFVNNDSDVAGITAECCSIYLQSSNYVYRLQSVGIDTTFDRNDVREIGSTQTVARGVKDITARITLGRILEQYTVEEILRGKANSNYGIIDVKNFSSNINLIVKMYSDTAKTQFKIGYKFLNLAPTGVDTGSPLNDYVTRGVTLEGQTGFVTRVNAVL